MEIILTPIQNLLVVETHSHSDQRGSFARLYCEQQLSDLIGDRRVVQVNHSHTRAIGSVRGLHFQNPPNSEMKLIRCIKGRVWDVAVDLRRSSSTFLSWYAIELSEDNNRMIIIPEGFAHGFQALEKDSKLIYLHTAFYSPVSEAGFRYNDKRISINWPLSVSNISERDLSLPFIDNNFLGVVL